MTPLDLALLALVAVAALAGIRKGLVWSLLSLAGLVGGALAGARLAQFLPGDDSPFAPIVALVAAIVGALLLETLASGVGRALQPLLPRPLRALDRGAGLAFGTAAGVVLVWITGALLLHQPAEDGLRDAAQRSAVLRTLNDVVAPDRVLRALERLDPFPTITGPPLPTQPPDPETLDAPGVAAAADSVARVVGTACGLSMTGSGWVAAPQLVVTNAHVVAGQRDTRVSFPGTGWKRAQPVAFDVANDLAVLRVDGLDARPLALARPVPATAVAVLGYPGGRRTLAVTPARIGVTSPVRAPDAYGEELVRRTVTSFRGEVRRGNSGGPAVDADGRVVATVFAARVGGSGGFAVPSGIVRNVLVATGGANAAEPVSTGSCRPG